MDDFRKGAKKGREGGGAPQGEPPSEPGWFQRLATWKKVSLVALGGLVIVIAVAVGSGEEEPAREAPAPAAGGKVQVAVVGARSGVADPFPGDDPTFNDNHVIYRVDVAVENPTADRVAVDSYLKGPGGTSVNSPDLFIVEPESDGLGVVYFGWLKVDPPPTRLLLDDPQNGRVLYRGPLPVPADA